MRFQCIILGLRQAMSHSGKPGWVWDADVVQRSYALSTVPTAECLEHIALSVRNSVQSESSAKKSGKCFGFRH